MAPLIVAERWIILFMISLIDGIIRFHRLDHIWWVGKPFQHNILCHFYLLGYPGLAMSFGALRFKCVYGDVFNYVRRHT